MPKLSPLMFILAGAAGGALAVGAMLLASSQTGFPLMLIPFGTSILVVFGTPEAPPAQPRALIGGHLISAAVGLAAVKLFGPHAWVAACAVGLAMVAMHLTGSFHPPAGIDPLLIVTQNMPLSFIVAPVAIGALALALFAAFWHRFVTRAHWPQGRPQRWW